MADVSTEVAAQPQSHQDVASANLFNEVCGMSVDRTSSPITQANFKSLDVTNLPALGFCAGDQELTPQQAADLLFATTEKYVKDANDLDNNDEAIDAVAVFTQLEKAGQNGEEYLDTMFEELDKKVQEAGLDPVITYAMKYQGEQDPSYRFEMGLSGHYIGGTVFPGGYTNMSTFQKQGEDLIGTFFRKGLNGDLKVNDIVGN